MKFFIYGSRRSGKTTQLLEILRMLNLTIVMHHGRSILKEDLKEFNVHTVRSGLYRYVDVHENIDTYTANKEIETSGTHSIITCTPDNNKNNIYTRPYLLYLHAIENGWAVINLSSPARILGQCQELNKIMKEEFVLGQLLGKWYDPFEITLETKTKT